MFGANTNHGSFAVPEVCSSNMRGGFLSTLKIPGSKKKFLFINVLPQNFLSGFLNYPKLLSGKFFLNCFL